MKSVIEFRNVVKRFGDKEVIHDLSFTISNGSIVALLGPNGAGKTTTISMMLGLLRPTSGTVKLFERDPNLASSREHIGAMLQQTSMPRFVKVIEIINLFRSYYNHPMESDELLHLANLQGDANKYVSKLSGGQKRRLEYALAMAGDPRILFLDEPTTGMDVAARREFWEHLRTFVREEGRTMILTTHHLEEADAIADRILVMQEGRMIADETPEQLKRLAGNRYVSFVAGEQVTEATLSTLPGADKIVFSGRHVRIRTRDADRVISALILGNYDVSQFEITSGQLEDAFITLTNPAYSKEENAV